MASDHASSDWPLQDAKAQFSRVVDTALRGIPQHVTRRGKPTVVVLSEESFAALQRGARAHTPSFVEHLLAIPKEAAPRAAAGAPTTSKPSAAARRATLALREVDFG